MSALQLRYVLPLLFLFFAVPNANGQIFKKLKKKAEKAAERTVERRVEKETEKKTDQALDSILEPGSKGKKGNPTEPVATPPPNGKKPNTKGQSSAPNSGEVGQKTMTIYSKFDFVPGDLQLFYDDFSNDFIGDFPSKWNTNGSGEIVTVNEDSHKWLEILSGMRTYYIPDVPNLPEEYTIEFDLFVVGVDTKTSSAAKLSIILDDNNGFSYGKDYAYVYLPFCQYTPIGIRIENRIANKETIDNTITADIREAILNTPHISIAVNKQRYRLWVDEKKYVDIPRLVSPNSLLKSLKFELRGFKDGKERLLLSNLKVAKGGLDLRRALIASGRVTTNGILFDSGSSNIQPQSMGIIRQISQVLQQEKDMRLRIIGHTDSDGTDEANLTLSKERAEAIKNALISVYKVNSDRLETEGKGEMQPVGDNNSAEGKAQNRRVDFIRQ